QDRGDILDRHRNALAYRAADLVYILIVQDRKEPSAQISPRLPEMLFGNGADQAALHEIVGSRRVPSERPSVSPQPRNFILQKQGKTVHRITLWVFILVWPRRLGWRVNIVLRCNPFVATDNEAVKCCF